MLSVDNIKPNLFGKVDSKTDHFAQIGKLSNVNELFVKFPYTADRC